MPGQPRGDVVRLCEKATRVSSKSEDLQRAVSGREAGSRHLEESKQAKHTLGCSCWM